MNLLSRSIRIVIIYFSESHCLKINQKYPSLKINARYYIHDHTCIFGRIISISHQLMRTKSYFITYHISITNVINPCSRQDKYEYLKKENSSILFIWILISQIAINFLLKLSYSLTLLFYTCKLITWNFVKVLPLSQIKPWFASILLFQDRKCNRVVLTILILYNCV